jgi:Ras-related protein Rab-8A
MASDNRPHDHLIKILLLGDSGVGKSCLLLRFTEDTFTPNFIATIGIDFKVRNVELDGRVFKVQIWDTAGQERFRAITQAFYRSVAGIMLVYDITNESTFRGLRDWMRSISQYANDSVDMVLVGNKCDLVGARQVTTKQGLALAEEFRMPFFECSAKTSDNVDKAFMCLIKTVKRRLFDNAATSSPSSPDSVPLRSPTDSYSTNNGCRC